MLPMPIFLDRHDLSGLTAADIAEAHRKDLEVQDRYGVRFLTYWFDESRGTGFCLIDAPDIRTAMRVHDEAHGDVAKDVIEVDLSAVQAFLGRVSDPEPSGEANDVKIDSALRAIGLVLDQRDKRPVAGDQHGQRGRVQPQGAGSGIAPADKVEGVHAAADIQGKKGFTSGKN